MHNWGDENVDWEGIGEAAWFIAKNLRRWGRVGVRDWKEKYGTVRVYCSFGWSQIQCIVKPGWCFNRWPRWLWLLDCNVGRHLVRPLNKIVVPYQTWLYTYIYGRAIKKWPHLRLEILSGADYHELLKKYGVHTIKTADRSSEIHYDWHKDNFVYPKEDPEDLPYFERSMDEIWRKINSLSPATSIVLNQDYEGIITVKVKLASQDVYESTGHTEPRFALLRALDDLDKEPIDDSKDI